MSIILITGGTGFLGRYIIEALDTAENKQKFGFTTVRLMVRTPSKTDDITLTNFEKEVVKGDLTDHQSLKQATKDVDAVLHVAALLDQRSKLKAFRKANVEGTRVLIENLKPGTKFVLTSSAGVYGFPNIDDPITEEYEPKKPSSHYQTSKKEQEELAKELCKEKNIPFIALRPPNIIGPREYFVVPEIVENIKKGRMNLFRGRESMQPIAHPKDVAQAHMLALEKITEHDGASFNVNSFHVPLKEYLDFYTTALDLKPVTRVIPYKLAITGATIADLLPFRLPLTRDGVRFISAHTYLDDSKIKDKLGYTPEYDVEKTMQETMDWYKEVLPKSLK